MDDCESVNQDFRNRSPILMAGKPIRSEMDYGELLLEIQRILRCNRGEAEDDRLVVLSALASVWEAEQAER